MKAQVLTGTKAEIAEAVTRIDGRIHEVIAFVEEFSNGAREAPEAPAEDIFAEMEPFTARAGGADYSRESIYMCLEGE